MLSTLQVNMQATQSNPSPTRRAQSAPLYPPRQPRRLPSYRGGTDSNRPSTPYNFSYPAAASAAPHRPDPVLIDATISPPRRLRSPTQFPPTSRRHPQARLVDIPPLHSHRRSIVPASLRIEPLTLHRQPPTTQPHEPLNLISPKVRFSLILPTIAYPLRPTTNSPSSSSSDLPRPRITLTSPPPIHHRDGDSSFETHRRFMRALDVRAALQRRRERHQREEDLLHQARLREIARVMGDEVERRGGRAFRQGELLGVRGDGAGWVDVELGESRLVRGGREGWMGRCVGGFKKGVVRTAGLVGNKACEAWEWLCRGENLAIQWVLLFVLLCLIVVVVVLIALTAAG